MSPGGVGRRVVDDEDLVRADLALDDEASAASRAAAIVWWMTCSSFHIGKKSVRLSKLGDLATRWVPRLVHATRPRVTTRTRRGQSRCTTGRARGAHRQHADRQPPPVGQILAHHGECGERREAVAADPLEVLAADERDGQHDHDIDRVAPAELASDAKGQREHTDRQHRLDHQAGRVPQAHVREMDQAVEEVELEPRAWARLEVPAGRTLGGANAKGSPNLAAR